MTNRRPNILWISLEDTSPRFGCYGDTAARTPNLDRLAAEGRRYPNTFSTCGVCAPARSAIITGMYPTSIGTHHMRTAHSNAYTEGMPTPYSAVPPHYVKCFSEYLRAAGYYCTNNVKTDYQFECPISAWDDCSNNGHWRNRPDPEQPFFAVFNPTMTHESGTWPEKCPTFTFDPATMVVPPYLPDTPKVREAMARLYTNLEIGDGIVGELLEQLEEDALADNTIVFHWSDHGPLPRGKRWPYDEGIHVPLIVRWPGELGPGTVTDRLVNTLDLGPTVLSLAGVQIPGHMQGKAFLGAQEAPPREYAFASRDRHDESYDMVRAARDKRFKYMRHFRPDLPYLSWIPYRNRHPILQEMWRLHAEGKLEGPQELMFQYPRPVEELYDTVADPWEVDNLAGDPAYAPELERLRRAMDDWRDEVGDLGEMDESQMVRQWYPDGVQPRTAAPLLVPICEESPGREVAPDGGRYAGPVLMQLHCATQGASIVYTFEPEEAPHWLLYSTPLRFPQGATTVRARAMRIGYAPSEEVSATFEVV